MDVETMAANLARQVRQEIHILILIVNLDSLSLSSLQESRWKMKIHPLGKDQDEMTMILKTVAIVAAPIAGEYMALTRIHC